MFKFKRIDLRADTPRVSIVKNEAEATVFVYDAIGDFYGVNANDFVRELSAITAPKINLRINSPGGDVFAAKAIATAIRNHHATVTAYIDGLAASAATTIAIAADEVVMSPGAFFMIHNPWTMAMGDAQEMAKLSAMLEKVGQSIAAEYSAKTGLDAAQITDMMNAETWMNADEALANGFVNRIDAGMKAAAIWDLSGYEKAPEIAFEVVNEEPAPAEKFNMEAMQRRLSMLERIA